MSIITTTLIAIALSMDAFAVSISSGIGMAKMRLRYALRMALFFWGFQAIMPGRMGIGYYASDYIQRFDHWVSAPYSNRRKMIMNHAEVDDGKDRSLLLYLLLSWH